MYIIQYINLIFSIYDITRILLGVKNDVQFLLCNGKFEYRRK